MRFALWLLPAGMTAWNILYFTAHAILEGRMKPSVAKFIILYAGTIKPAMEGDLEPFIRVMSMP